MAWIEYHTQLREHWKIQRLADYLGVEYHFALGLVSCLWLWCVDYAPDGNVTKFSDAEIRRGVRTNVENFCKEALKKCELIDDKDRINDWKEHGIKYLESTRLRVRKHRLQKRYRNVTVTPTLPNLTIPNHTLPKETKEGEGKTAPPTTKIEPNQNGVIQNGVSPNGHSPTPADLIALWNKLAHPNLPRVEMLTDVRKTRIKRRLADYPEKKFWDSLMVKVNSSKMLTGENNRGWKCSFDWIINENNMAKILEGNYDDTSKFKVSA